MGVIHILFVDTMILHLVGGGGGDVIIVIVSNLTGLLYYSVYCVQIVEP